MAKVKVSSSDSPRFCHYLLFELHSEPFGWIPATDTVSSHVKLQQSKSFQFPTVWQEATPVEKPAETSTEAQREHLACFAFSKF